jgi:hypothetical protein
MPTLFEFACGERQAVREHIEFGTRVAMQNPHATTDEEQHPLREVPRWSWPGNDGSPLPHAPARCCTNPP